MYNCVLRKRLFEDKRVKLTSKNSSIFRFYIVLYFTLQRYRKKSFNLVESEIQLELKIIKDGIELLRE